MSLKAELLKIYEDSLKEGRHTPAKVHKEIKPIVGQIREVWSVPVERFLVLSYPEEGLYLTAPMTAYLPLVPEGSPIYELRSLGLRLAVLPAWDYLREEFIKNYTSPIGRVPEEEVKRIEEWVKGSQDSPMDYAVRRFIKLNSKRWARWTMASLLFHADLAEEGGFRTIRLDAKTERSLDPYRTFALAAENRYFRGENFFAVLIENGLRLYLPVELLGKSIRIMVGEVVIFEGKLEETALELEGSFSGINPEGVLKVVEL